MLKIEFKEDSPNVGDFPPNIASRGGSSLALTLSLPLTLPPSSTNQELIQWYSVLFVFLILERKSNGSDSSVAALD